MRLVTFDTESDGFVNEATIIWCASAHDHTAGETRSWVIGEDLQARQDFLDYLETADVLVGHNLIGHDLPLLCRLFGWQPKPGQKVVDTLLMSRLQRPDRRIPPHCPRTAGPHSVHSWGYRLGHPKVEHDEWDRFSPEMLTRCVEDVQIQVKILKALEDEGHGEGWGRALRMTMELFSYLQEQEATGVAVDRLSMERSVAQLTRWIDKIDRAVTPHLPVVIEIEEGKVKGEYGYVKKPFLKSGDYAKVTEGFLARYAEHSDSVGYCIDNSLVGGPFSRVAFRYTDLDSNAEIKDFLLKSGWVPDQWNTNNAGQRTSPKLSKDDRFIGVQGSLGKLIVKRVQCRQRRGVIQGWIDFLDGSSIWQTKQRLPAIVHGLAVTGRARHKLVVNVPGSKTFYGKQMRSMFIATPGWDLVGVDSKTNQVRQLAARMGDDDFTRIVLDDNIDLHSYNRDRAGIDYGSSEADKKRAREAAKTFYYALIFGAGDAKLARQLGISLPEAKALRRDFLGGLPALETLLEKLGQEWECNGGWIRGLDGRPITVPGRHQLLVYLLQSDEAIQMSHAYCETWRRCNATFGRHPWNIVLFMHDEYAIECEPEIAKEVGRIGSEAIAWAGEYLGIPVPHEGDVKIGRTWLDVH